MAAENKGGGAAKKPQKLQIQLDEKAAGGHYVNFVMINHNPTEFVVDLIFMQPKIGRAHV